MTKEIIKKLFDEALGNDVVSASYLAVALCRPVPEVDKACEELEREGLLQREQFGGGKFGWRAKKVTK